MEATAGQGHPCGGKERVQQRMQLHGIRTKGRRRLKVTADSDHDLPIAPNLLERQFTVARPDKVWAGDLAYIATDEGWQFQAAYVSDRGRPFQPDRGRQDGVAGAARQLLGQRLQRDAMGHGFEGHGHIQLHRIDTRTSPVTLNVTLTGLKFFFSIT
jgi:transposase InsO family protein